MPYHWRIAQKRLSLTTPKAHLQIQMNLHHDQTLETYQWRAWSTDRLTWNMPPLITGKEFDNLVECILDAQEFLASVGKVVAGVTDG